MLVDRSLQVSRLRRYSPGIRLLRLALVPVIIIGLSVLPRQSSTAQAGWGWYKADMHTHSALSADTYVDLGILSQNARNAGLDALFVSDHNLGSEFPAHGIAHTRPFEDSYLKWNKGTYGTQTSTVNELATSPVNTGSKSLHLLSASSGSAETQTWGIRGPNLRSGEITLNFSVYPTQITAGSGAYVSVSIGGDARVTTPPAPGGGPPGYTTQAGVISPGKSTLLVWQLGSARTASSNSNARVITYPLTYTLNAWNHYTINVSNALLDIPVADRPVDYNGLTYIKMAAASNNGTVDAYFDSFLLKAAAPVSPANEFIYRNSIISSYDTAAFKMFPSVELGDSTHVNRFDFNITNASQFVSYADGINGILATQQGGYPAQLNHPGSDGGVTDQEAINNQGYGADLMEVPRNANSIQDWDAILNQGVQILGTGSTDKHTASYSTSSNGTRIYAPALEFDALMRSLFEGRTHMVSGLSGPANFNLESGLQEPYPARYPVYVPGTLSAINVHLGIPSGISPSHNVYWIRNGLPFATDSVGSSSYDVVKSIPLDGATTYVRAEVRLISNADIRAMTQPIFFRDVPNLPADKRFYVNGVTTTNGRGYTRITTKGITASSWSTADQTLSLTLENATGSLVDLRMYTNTGPQQILVNGLIVSPTSSLSAFEAATGSSWYYNSTGTLLYLKVKHASGTANVAINFSAQPPATATFTPIVTATETGMPTPTLTPVVTGTSTPVVTGTATLPGSGTFGDVPESHWAGQYIERLYRAGITGGCASSPAMYCPTAAVTRAQMAVFLLRGKHGSGYVPPAGSGTVFGDVPAGYWAGAWIEQLAAEGITGGCGGGMYCPEQAVTRDQMAVFLLRARHGSGYVPPVGSGAMFGDVPADYWAGAWIEQLVAEGITAGCGGGMYCPAQAVTRDQMAVFLVRTFNLP